MNEKDIQEMKRDIQEMKRDIKEMKKSTEKMNEHINFIEDVYNNIKSPLYYICDKISGKPAIQNEKIDE